MSQPDAKDEDAGLLPFLDAYLEELHAGRQPDRPKLLGEHPELAPLLDCLDSLNKLAPPLLPPGEITVFRQEAPAAGNAEILPPLIFGKFELLGEIGRGGMGVVYKARQTDLDRIVALKMILSGPLASKDVLRRFQAEAKAAARLAHPNIVHIYEAGELQGFPYFAMRYLGGFSLAQVLAQGPATAEQAARWVATVAGAVDHLHAQAIVHRDLKPSNIVLDEHGQPHVTDFGLAKLLESDSRQTGTGAILGTPCYMAPEQAAGQLDQVGPASDVYSLGAILYELLTGRPPFREDSPLDTLVQVLEAEPVAPRQINPAIPRSLEMICLKCLEKRQEARYPSAKALADDLERYLAGEEVAAQPAGCWRRLVRWTREQPALASRLGTLAVVSVIVQVRYLLSPDVRFDLHLQTMLLLAGWMLASSLCQWSMRTAGWEQVVRFAWATVDVVFLTGLLQMAAPPTAHMLLAGYPVLIAASGLWFRVRLVWFTTILAEVGHGWLVVDAWQRAELVDPHRHVIFAAALVIVGFVVAYQVKRVRVLSQYYGHREPGG